ncbi:MAG: vitamin B12 dependent methionine synthase [Lentisphaerales bacterium]|jgi:hypothetical protein|nr:MAG: vitamin B12 dependent methionine synthase [Lentisphaerales bacterium]
MCIQHGEGDSMPVLDKIPFEIDTSSLFERTRIEPTGEYSDEIRELAAQAAVVARPKAVYAAEFVSARYEESITVGTVTFQSRVLGSNLGGVERVFPYVVTCGVELDEIPVPEDDHLLLFCREIIKEMALSAGVLFLRAHLTQTYAVQKVTSMSPGSGDRDVWPIEQQKELFHLLGDVRADTGVVLTDNCLMIPNKSVSGIIYPAEIDFATCRLCHREKCPSRKAEFDAAMWEEHGLAARRT